MRYAPAILCLLSAVTAGCTSDHPIKEVLYGGMQTRESVVNPLPDQRHSETPSYLDYEAERKKLKGNK